ncbi:MAG TPA: DUF5719 family protein [Actinomycetota bacterium]|jgi:hypothetical protein|nr:DUF5719 family protein [Actinomycetota bacterium]
MSPEGYNGSHDDAPRDESWPFGPFRQDDEPLRPRSPLRDPFEPRPFDPQPDPFISSEDPLGLDDPFRATAPPFDPRRDYLDPFLPEADPAPPPSPPPGSVAPEPSGSPADTFGAGGQRGQAPIPSRAARHQAKRRMPWRPARGPSGPPPARPSGGAGPPAGGPPVGGPAADSPPFEPGEPGGWQSAGQPGQTLWPSPPEDGARQDSPEHTEPFGHADTGERIEPGTSNGSAGPEAPPRRGRALAPSRPRLALPKLAIPAGLGHSSLTLAAILVVAAFGLGAVSSALPTAKRPPAPATAPPYSARWVCPLLPGKATSVDVANVGAGTAALRTTVIGGSARGQPSQHSLGAGANSKVKVPAAKQPRYVQVESFSAPVVVSAGGQAGCAPGPTDRLWIPTSDTSLGASTTVVIANPDSDPAVVALVPHVSQGSQQAVAEVFVAPRSAVTKPFSYGQLVGLKPAIEVIAKSGRVVAGAVITQKDKHRIYVPAQTSARTEWSFAGGLAGPDRSTSVLITNPSSGPLSVSVQVSTDRGTFKPGNDFDNPVPAGAAVAVQVPPLRIGGSGAFAVRVRSRDHAPFVAALRVTTGTASYVDLGAGEPDSRWLVPAVPASRRVVLANLSGDALSVRLTGAGAGDGATVKVGPGKVIVRQLPARAKGVQVTTDQAGLLVASLGSGLVLPGAAIGGLPPGGPVIAGPAAA